MGTRSFQSNEGFHLQLDDNFDQPKQAKRYISSMLLLKLGWRDSGYFLNSIMTVPHIPAAAHGYVFFLWNNCHVITFSEMLNFPLEK